MKTTSLAPTTLHDYFGSVELDEGGKSYRAALTFSSSHTISVAIDWAGISPAEALRRSQDICEQVRIREPEYRDAVARKLLPLYNESWGNGEVIEMDGFMRRISLAEIRVSPVDFGTPCCAVLYYYADGGLFAGHAIEVFLDGDFQYDNSQIAG